MVEALLAISVLIWLPVLLYQMIRRGFLVLTIWLVIAPFASNLISGRSNPFIAPPPSSDEVEEQRPLKKGQKPSSYTTAPTRITARELLEPNRIVFGMFFLVFFGGSLLRTKRLPSLDRTEIWMAIFAVLVLANLLIFSNRFASSAKVAIDAFVVPFLSYFAARRLVRDQDRFEQFIRILAYLGCFLIILGLIEFALHPPPHRVQGPFHRRDYLYVCIMVTFFMVSIDAIIHGFNRKPAVIPRWMRLFVGIGSPVIVLLTLTRGNWVGFLAGVWMFAFLTRKLLTSRQKLVTVGLGVGLLPIILLGALELSQTELLHERTTNTKNIELRLATYALVVDVAVTNPVFGIGLNNLRDFLYGTQIRGKTLGTAHNSYLAITAELGLLALLAYFALMWSMFRTGLRIFREERETKDRLRGIILVSMLTAYLVPGLFTHIAYNSTLLHLYLFVSAGVIAGRYKAPRMRVINLVASVKAKEPFYPELASGK